MLQVPVPVRVAAQTEKVFERVRSSDSYTSSAWRTCVMSEGPLVAERGTAALLSLQNSLSYRETQTSDHTGKHSAHLHVPPLYDVL